VAFDFRHARVLGLTSPVPPGLCTFPEVNLRFYARKGDDQCGVVFIAELVPNPFVAWAANASYNEHYTTVRMTSRATVVGPLRRVRHDIVACGKRHTVAATGLGEARHFASGSSSEFFTNRAWGFGISRFGKPITYRVMHPSWRTFPVDDIFVDVDFTALYGTPWSALTNRAPDSVILAEGSEVAVYPWG